MKKLSSIFLALVMLLSTVQCATAAETKLSDSPEFYDALNKYTEDLCPMLIVEPDEPYKGGYLQIFSDNGERVVFGLADNLNTESSVTIGGYIFTNGVFATEPEKYECGLGVYKDGKIYTYSAAAAQGIITLDELADVTPYTELTSAALETAFREYLKTQNEESEFVFCDLGNVDGYRLVYGYNILEPLEYGELELGAYTVISPATIPMNTAGLYVYKNREFCTLKSAYSSGKIKNQRLLISLLKNNPHLFKVTLNEDKEIINILKKNNISADKVVKLGQINSLRLVYAVNTTIPVTEAEENYAIGNLRFRAWHGNGLGLYFITNSETAFAVTEDNYLDDKYIFNSINKALASGESFHWTVEYSEPETQPQKKLENEPVAKDAPLEAFKLFVYNKEKKNNNNLKLDDIKVEIFEKIKSGFYLERYSLPDAKGTDAIYNHKISGYTYTLSGGASYVYIYANGREYGLKSAYKKGILKEKDLQKISRLLRKYSGASLEKSVIELKAGEEYRVGLPFNKYTSSNKKAAKTAKSKDKQSKVAIALTKGSFKIKENGTRFVVVSDPKLSEKSVTVKKGRTVRIKIIGKARTVNNKYKNTKLARITSKKSSDTLTVKGLKRGSTKLTVTVNGKKLRLSVTIK